MFRLALLAILLIIVWPRSKTTELSGAPDRVVDCGGGTLVYISPETDQDVCG